MAQVKPSDRLGCPIEEIDTPALVVDAGILDTNIHRMADFGKRMSIGIRPHAKAHKSPVIAHKPFRPVPLASAARS